MKCTNPFLFFFLFAYMVFMQSVVLAQSLNKAELVGSVRDDFGMPVANVAVFNETEGEILYSNISGNFRINVTTGDTLTLLLNQYKKVNYIVPTLDNLFVFQDFTMSFNREAALIQFKAEKSEIIYPTKKEAELNEFTLAGRVVSANGNVLVNANISLFNALDGTVTNKNGVYRMQVSPGDSLFFSFMGYTPQLFLVESQGNDVVMKDVMLVPSAFMLQGVKVTGNKLSLNLQYSNTGMDVGEIAKYTLRNHAMQTDKTRIQTFGVSTASFGGLSEIFGGKKKKGLKEPSQKVKDRQAIMRKKVLEAESHQDSTVTPEGNL